MTVKQYVAHGQKFKKKSCQISRVNELKIKHTFIVNLGEKMAVFCIDTEFGYFQISSAAKATLAK